MENDLTALLVHGQEELFRPLGQAPLNQGTQTQHTHTCAEATPLRSDSNSAEVKGANRSPHLGDFQVQQLVLTFHKIIPSDPSLLDDAVAEIRAVIDRTACWNEVESIALAVREAVANAIVHGNHCNPAKVVGVSVAANENCDLLIVVRDSGSGFDPSKLPNPTAGENLLANHGRGILLVKQLMDEVDFKFDHGTEVRMLRRRQWLE
jgi:anti-sigma regulatory factor (Ser/Thr protein kinase)